MVFEPTPAGGPPALGAPCARHLETRLGALPRYRQRLSERRTGGPCLWPALEAV